MVHSLSQRHRLMHNHTHVQLQHCLNLCCIGLHPLPGDLPPSFVEAQDLIGTAAQLGTVDCQSKLPSGATVYNKFKIRSYPLPAAFTVANGRKPAQVLARHFKTPQGLAEAVRKAVQVQVMRIQSSADLARCTKRDACALIVTGSALHQDLRAELRQLADKHRAAVQFGVLNSTLYELQGELPDALNAKEAFHVLRRLPSDGKGDDKVLASRSGRTTKVFGLLQEVTAARLALAGVAAEAASVPRAKEWGSVLKEVPGVAELPAAVEARKARAAAKKARQARNKKKKKKAGKRKRRNEDRSAPTSDDSGGAGGRSKAEARRERRAEARRRAARAEVEGEVEEVDEEAVRRAREQEQRERMAAAAAASGHVPQAVGEEGEDDYEWEEEEEGEWQDGLEELEVIEFDDEEEEEDEEEL